MTPHATVDATPQRASLTIPLVALVLSFVTTAGGSYVSMQINSARTEARMEATEKRVDENAADLKGMVPKDQFTTAMTNLKEQLAEMKTDIKEIRRAVVVPR